MKEFIQCRLCSKKPGPKGMPGFYYLTLPNGQQAIAECSCHRKFVQEELLRIEAEKAGVWYSEYTPDQYVGSKSKKNVQNLKTYVERFQESKFSSSILYLYGPNGTQKTTLAQWMGLSLLRKGFSVRYMLMQYLVTKLKDKDFETDENILKELETLKTIDCLILDESFNASSVTLYKSGYQIPFLNQFLKDRIEVQKKSIIFVSNTAPEAISKAGFGGTLESLITRNTSVRGSALTFEDVYHSEVNAFDVETLFD